MALGANLTQVSVTGTYVDFAGTAIAGQIRFTLTSFLQNGIDNQMVAPSSVVVPLVNGTFTTQLPATNDPDIIPTAFLYTVEESFVGGRTYTISLPYDSVGTLDLIDLSPDPVLSIEYAQLIQDSVWTPLVADIAALDAAINQSTGTIPVTGKYWYIDGAYSTYTAIDAAFASYTALNAATFNIQASSISSFVTLAEAETAAATASAAQAVSLSTGSINPLLLIGG